MLNILSLAWIQGVTRVSYCSRSPRTFCPRRAAVRRCRTSSFTSCPLGIVHPSCSIIPYRSPVASLHRSSTVPARESTTSRSNVNHHSRHVGHHNRPFSPLRASPISVSPPPLHDMHIFDVIKCHHFYRQPPPSALWHPTKNVFNVGKCGGVPLTLAAHLNQCASAGVWSPDISQGWL